MQLTTVLTPLSDENLQLACQAGVTHVTLRYPGDALADLLALQQRVESFGLQVAAIEGYLPIDHAIMGDAGRDRDIAALSQLIRNMAEAGIGMLCYNFMAGTDWVRTTLDARERGGARVTGFDLAQIARAMSLNHATAEVIPQSITASALWANLAYFLDQLLPIAEAAGVVLAMHPDDPPLDSFLGRARILNSIEGFERLMALAPSEHNAICFCQGTFVEMGVDIPAAIHRLGRHIRYVHFRDVRGTRERFVETFHDNGPTDMYAAIRAYRDVGFDGPIRPDHVPQLAGEEKGEPGYTMLGRLFAFGYMRGLIEAARAE